MRSLKGHQRVCPGSALQLSARPGGWQRPWPSVLSRQRHWPLRLSTNPAREQAGTPTRPWSGHRGPAQEHWPVIEQAWPGCCSHAVSTQIPPQSQRRVPVLPVLLGAGLRLSVGCGCPWSAVVRLCLGPRCVSSMVRRQLQMVALT